MASVTETHLIVNRNLRIPLGEIELRAVALVRARRTARQQDRVDGWRPYSMLSLGGARARTSGRACFRSSGPIARAVAQDERSQLRNRELALVRLGDRIADALHVERKRKPTKPSKGAKESRLKAKRTRSEVKSQRRKPSADD